MQETTGNIDALIDALPKAELHLHIEGTLEPELIFALAERHGVAPPYPSLAALRAAYNFGNLQSFLDLYYAAMSLLRDAEDFHALASAYFTRAAAQGVVHAELFFDPQAHLARGIAFETVLEGLESAMHAAARKHHMTAKLIMCFLRDKSAEDAMATLEHALPFGDRIAGVGLDSAETGHPPSKFSHVFARARSNGWKAVAHAGEEGPPSYIWEALDLLHVARIDHGVRALEDATLVERLRAERVPLTVCPLSNVRLRVFERMEDHNLGRMLAAGLCATVNSDDPAYFGGYISENYRAVAHALHLTAADVIALARNAFEAAFIGDDARAARYAQIAAIGGA